MTQPSHFDYIAEAHVTMSPNFHGEMCSRQDMQSAFDAAIESLAALDRLKKALFYGRGQFHDNLPLDLPALVEGPREASLNLFHCVIGLATEAGELLEGIREQVFDTGEQVDRVNMVEEVGDVFWYAAGILKACGYNFEDAQRRNIDKLRRRYPEKFTEYDANNRDLFSEREALEGVAPEGSNVA